MGGKGIREERGPLGGPEPSVPGWLPVGSLGTAPEMNQTRSTTAFDVTLANGSRERIDAEEVSVADISLMFSGAGQPDPYLRRCRKPWL